jgi:hypothetical protein
VEVTLSVLADGANTTAEGKLNLLGIFQTINTMSVPYQHPQMYLVLSCILSPGERGTNQGIKVVLVDPDGAFVGNPPEMQIHIPADLSGLTPTFNLILALNNLVFPRFGPYVFDVLINNSSRARIPLVVQPPPPGIGPQAGTPDP